jgi:hypothetical protein
MPSRKFSLVVCQVLFVLLAYTLLQGHLFLRQRREMNPRTRRRLLQLLNPTLEVVAVYYQQRFCLLSLGEFATILLELEESPRQIAAQDETDPTRRLPSAAECPATIKRWLANEPLLAGSASGLAAEWHFSVTLCLNEARQVRPQSIRFRSPERN